MTLKNKISIITLIKQILGYAGLAGMFYYGINKLSDSLYGVPNKDLIVAFVIIIAIFLILSIRKVLNY